MSERARQIVDEKRRCAQALSASPHLSTGERAIIWILEEVLDNIEQLAEAQGIELEKGSQR